jgi:oligosaccharide repeat unit polymerase
VNNRRLLLHIPVVLFSAIWVTVIPLYLLDPYNFPSLSFNSWLTIYASHISLVLGYYLLHVSYLPTLKFGASVDKYYISFEEAGFSKVTLVLSIIPLIGSIIAFNMIIDMLGGIENYFFRPLYARHAIVEFQRGTLANWSLGFSFTNYMISVGYLTSILGGITFSFDSRRRWIGLLPLIIGLLSSLVFLKRYAFIQSSTFWMFSYLFTVLFSESSVRKKLIRRFFRMSVIMLSVFLVFVITLLVYRASQENKIFDFIFESIYSYFVGGVGAFHNLIELDLPLTYGTTTFRSLFKWLDRIKLWQLDNIVGSQLGFTKVGSQYLNTYTYLYSIYRDYGFIGSMIFSFSFGMLTRFSLEKLFMKYSLMRLFWVVTFSFTLLMSFYSFFFDSLTSIILWAIMLYYIEKYILANNLIKYYSPRNGV